MIMAWVFDLQPNQMTLDEVLMSNCGTLAAEAVSVPWVPFLFVPKKVHQLKGRRVKGKSPVLYGGDLVEYHTVSSGISTES